MMNIKCKHCYGINVIRKGLLHTKYEDKQIYLCKDCNRKFTLGVIQKKTYAPQIVIAAITTYTIGHSLDQTKNKINQRFKVNLSRSTIHTWVKEHENILSYLPLRDGVRRKYGYDILAKRIFKHSGLNYHFKYHKPKLHLRCKQTGLNKLQHYIENLYLKGTPPYFGEGRRCSMAREEISSRVKRAYNDACRLAGVALQAARKNSERHSIVEEFMLINDASTVAVEIPVWYYDKKQKSNISGHIDILQIRGNKIHILDYKPEARLEKYAASQLYRYAVSLAYRTGISLQRISCAWFDDRDYFIFLPSS